MVKKYWFLFLVFIFAGCAQIEGFFHEEETSTILLLYTNDEHGHIYENDGWYKAVALYEMWEDEEKNCKNCAVVKLSGGDNYTGTAVSTFFKGVSTAEVMGLLGYRVSALGNHEFDFGERELKNNAKTANMQYISSNVVSKEMKNLFDPSTVIYAGNEKILFVSAITEEVKRISMAQPFVESTIAKPENTVPNAIAKENADLNIIVAHESHKEAKTWVSSLPQKPLIVFTAHDHKEAHSEENGVLFIQNAGYLPSYAKVLIEKKGKNSKVMHAEIVPLKREIELKSTGSLEMKKTIDKYLALLEKETGQTLISAGKPLKTPALQKLFACSMLRSFPEYDAAFSNPGGFRDSIKAGDVKKSDILSIFPFDNFIVTATVQGEDLIFDIEKSENAYCGVTKKNKKWFVGNEEIDKSKTYKIVTTDFVYQGGDGYRFTDSQGITTSVSWRTPLENYLIESSKKGWNLEKACEKLVRE
ncbi:bifunctional metallophosphatase/5'-nucleotidase [bacterium]|nr:bifunctional metallophosphatase/5'-nucleotidase [bacterium]